MSFIICVQLKVRGHGWCAKTKFRSFLISRSGQVALSKNHVHQTQCLLVFFYYYYHYYWFIHSFTHSFIHFGIHLFICVFIYVCIHAFVWFVYLRGFLAVMPVLNMICDGSLWLTSCSRIGLIWAFQAWKFIVSSQTWLDCWQNGFWFWCFITFHNNSVQFKICCAAFNERQV